MENTGAVLAGRALSPEVSMRVRKVKVLRPFYFNRELQPKDKVLELPELLALECLGAKKVEPVEEAASAAPLSASKDEGKGKDGKHAGK